MQGVLVSFIYLITNTANGKQYVGQTRRNPLTRWKQHVQSAKHVESKTNLARAFARAINKYGADAFRMEVIVAMKLKRMTMNGCLSTCTGPACLMAIT